MLSASAKKILWLVNLSIFISFVKIFEIPPLIPTLVTDLNISYAQAGIFMSIYALTKCLGSSPAGIVTDKWGAVPIMAVSLLGIGVFGVLGTIGSNYELLLLWRVLAAVFVSLLFIAAVDAIPKIMPPEKIGFGIGLINCSLNVGIAAALLATPIIAEIISWRSILLFTSLLCIVLFIYTLLLGNQTPVTDLEVRCDDQKDLDKASSFGSLLRNPVLLLIAIATGVLFVEMYGMLTWLPSYLTDVYQYSGAEVGVCSMMLGLAAIPASIVTGCLITNLQRILWLTLSGGIVASVGILALLSAQFPFWAGALIVAILTWGHTQVIVTIMSLVSTIIPQHSTGRALGIVFTLGYGGSILSTYLGGFLVERVGSYGISFLIFAAASSLSSLLMFCVYKKLLKKPTGQLALAKSF